MDKINGFYPWVEMGALACVASCFLYVGIRGLIQKKPFMLSTRWLVAILLPMPFKVSYQAALSGVNRGQLDSVGSINLLGAPIIMILCFWAWRLNVGYYIFGASEPSIRRACRHAIQRLGLPFEEGRSKIHLPSADGGSAFSFFSWQGFGMISAKKRNLNPLFPKIIGEISLHLNSVEDKIKRGFILPCFGFGLLFGLAFLAVIHRLILGEAS